MEGNWGGYRLTIDELKVALGLIDGGLIGLDLGELNEEEGIQGASGLFHKGLIHVTDDQAVPERVLSFVLKQMSEADKCLIYFDEEYVQYAVYPCEKLWVCVEYAYDAFTVLPVEGRNEAFQQTEAFAENNNTRQLQVAIVSMNENENIPPADDDDVPSLEELFRILEG